MIFLNSNKLFANYLLEILYLYIINNIEIFI